MVAQAIAWPRKTRELHNHHFKSTVWNDFKFRDGDIVVSTYAKCGTTWTQQIIGQLLFNGDPDVDVPALAPWLDLRAMPMEIVMPALEAQTHRRQIKTHLPVDALVFSPKAQYVYVGRDGRDTVWSLFNHHMMANDAWYAALNDTPGLVGPKIGRPHTTDVRQYFLDWLKNDGQPFWSLWENLSQWWALRHLPNVVFMHFADMKADLPGSIRRIARFLNIPIDEARFPDIVKHASFEWMKTHADKSAPLGGILWEGGAETFINKGTNGRWRDVLTAEDNALYERTAREKLGEECASWLANGGVVDDHTAR